MMLFKTKILYLGKLSDINDILAFADVSGTEVKNEIEVLKIFQESLMLR